MKRNNFFAQSCDAPAVCELPLSDDVESSKLPSSEADSVLDMVYAPDPVTRLPQNALGVFMSKKTSPLVREFIQRNLMLDNQTPMPSLPDGIEDSDLLTLQRDRNEPLSDYTKRVNAYMQHQKVVYNKAQRVLQSSKVQDKG